MDLFGGMDWQWIDSSLTSGIKVNKYLYVDKDPMAKKTAIEHIRKLKKGYPNLLPHKTTKTSFITLAQDIALINDA